MKKPVVVLQLNHGKLKAHADPYSKNGRVITSREQLRREFPDAIIACSSTLDFPEEFTKSAAVLRLVRSINK